MIGGMRSSPTAGLYAAICIFALVGSGLGKAGTVIAMDTPPDPNKAVAAEYQRVQDSGTAEAYALFIERHPDHPLAAEARKMLERLSAK